MLVLWSPISRQIRQVKNPTAKLADKKITPKNLYMIAPIRMAASRYGTTLNWNSRVDRIISIQHPSKASLHSEVLHVEPDA